jgi:hypothetical protein
LESGSKFKFLGYSLVKIEGIKSEYLDAYAHKKDENRQFYHRKVMKWREPTNEKLCVELESGSKFKFLGYSLAKIEG